MIIYLHGFDATSPGNYEKVLQLQFVDPDVRMVSYSTVYPRQDMSHLLKEVHRQLATSDDPAPLICGVGLGGYWSERIGFLCNIRQVMLNPNLFPEETMQGNITRPEEYNDIASKCVTEFRKKNARKCICILSVNDEVMDNSRTASELKEYYDIVWDEQQSHKFKDLSSHLQRIKAFKNAG